MAQNKSIVIVGPTCTGKTRLGLSLAQAFETSILSADSRQVYKELDIGTGKRPWSTNKVPYLKNESFWTIGGVKIYGYDLVSVLDYFSVQAYVTYAKHIWATLPHPPIVVGGTGFYISALFNPPTSVIPPNFELRQNLQTVPLAELKAQVESADKAYYASLNHSEQNNPQRLIRRLEILIAKSTNLATTISQSSAITSSPSKLTPEAIVYVGLTAPREQLYATADTWVETIWETGFIEETKQILTTYKLSPKPLAGLLYKTAVAYLVGQTTRAEAIQQCKFSMHAYIRRQQTWFKRNQKIVWFDMTDTNLLYKVKNLIES